MGSEEAGYGESVGKDCYFGTCRIYKGPIQLQEAESITSLISKPGEGRLLLRHKAAPRALSATWRCQIVYAAEGRRSTGLTLGCRSPTSCARVWVLSGGHAACVLRGFGLSLPHRVPAATAPAFPPLLSFDSRATHARTPLPAALASVSYGWVLVRVRISARRRERRRGLPTRQNFRFHWSLAIWLW